ncbi:putative bifunctional diguanylate cyclase/phosphodiesterase [Marinobacter adhaerens]|uniref:putative bifunctional diguanylate cyclase/phosphodiesterase n=1 Tax=Marinobacter adhaerens TaxID=1033846 RepID=UPI001E4D6D39|nr:GGDEF and EAL domain-containing protein [Marinobacter adhaerens]MCD1646505.1 EAL domain-containing protein [Marinobacter adhaerens]
MSPTSISNGKPSTEKQHQVSIEALRLVSEAFNLSNEVLADHNSLKFLMELIEYIPAVVFCHDMNNDDKCLFVSKSFETIWGLPRSALRANPRAWSELVVPEDRELVAKRFHNNTAMGVPVESDYRIRDTAGHLRYIHALFVNLPNPSGTGAHRIGFATDVTERKIAELRAIENAQRDPVTGLANRVAFSDVVASMLSERDQLPCSDPLYVVFIDIDRFSRINESLGHSVGDEYLRKIAERIKGFIGPRSYLARVGGDEFALILSDCDELSSTRSRLTGLQQALSRPISIDGEQIVTSACIGVASYPQDGDDPGSLLKAAELAMIVSKNRCRGSLSFFHSDLTNKSTRDRLRRDMELRRALENNQFELYYQGKFQGSSRVMTGAEVLLRWRHPDYGLVSPIEFIPLLEDSGDILEVGYWIVDSACAQLSKWKRSSNLPKSFSLAINVSPTQLLSADFADRVVQILDQHGIAPSTIELELTETAILTDPDHAQQVFHQLREAGLRIAIDDFGTGYSSMSYLRRFRPDTLKIDRSFSAGCDQDETALGIVESIIQLARTLGMTVVAEGIETEPQASCLSTAGCDLLQGYLLSKPAPVDQFELLMGGEPRAENT